MFCPGCFLTGDLHSILDSVQISRTNVLEHPQLYTALCYLRTITTSCLSIKAICLVAYSCVMFYSEIQYSIFSL